ncbi:MAG: hypothetical protein IH624_11165 [Phycisphaerae bacterium]|nr:hypothetical protein [Phycisphaerae bacterium]
MKRNRAAWCVACAGFAFVMCIGAAGFAAPAGTMFTYQGRLHDGGSPASGSHDFLFTLFDTAEAGVQVGTTVLAEDVELVAGQFTASLDFGDVFEGRQLWLQIGVRAGGSQDAFTTLSPRQRIGATPYAQKALNDSDTLAALQCGPGQVPKWSSTGWTCADDETGLIIPPFPPAVAPGIWKVVVRAEARSRLQSLMNEAADGRRFDGSLIYLDGDMKEGRRIDFFDAIPISYEAIHFDAMNAMHLRETMEFKVDRVALATSAASGSTKRLFSHQFVFKVNGEPVAGALIVEPGAIAFHSADAPLLKELPAMPEFPVVSVLPVAIAVDLPWALEQPDNYWKFVSGGALEIVSKSQEIAGYRFGDVILRGECTQRLERSGLVDWLNDWTRGGGRLTDGQLKFYDFRGLELMSVLYVKVRPVLYRPPSVDTTESAPLQEELTFRAMAIE